MDIEEQIKSLEEQASRIAEQKRQLLEAKQQQEAMEAKLDHLFQESGYETPKALVEALIRKFNVRITARGKAGTGATGKRRHTRMTAQLRDSLKQALADGVTKNALSKQTGISYVVIGKVEKGLYDRL